MVLRSPVSGYPCTRRYPHECNCKDTKKMAGLQDFHPKSCTFNTLFWTKKTEARQTGKNTSLTYSEYVVRGLSVRPLRTGLLTIFQLSSAKQVETACDPSCDPSYDPFSKRVTCLSPDKHCGFEKKVRV